MYVGVLSIDYPAARTANPKEGNSAKEPEDIATLDADVVLCFLFGPGQIEEFAASCVQQCFSLVILLASADNAGEWLARDVHGESAVSVLEFVYCQHGVHHDRAVRTRGGF